MAMFAHPVAVGRSKGRNVQELPGERCVSGGEEAMSELIEIDYLGRRLKIIPLSNVENPLDGNEYRAQRIKMWQDRIDQAKQSVVELENDLAMEKERLSQPNLIVCMGGVEWFGYYI